jgi:hypothetical protein
MAASETLLSSWSMAQRDEPFRHRDLIARSQEIVTAPEHPGSQRLRATRRVEPVGDAGALADLVDRAADAPRMRLGEIGAIVAGFASVELIDVDDFRIDAH